MESIPLSDDDSIGGIGPTHNVHVPISLSSGREEATLDEAEEKAQLINQVLQLQNTLDDLSQRVDAVKDENLKLKSENEILGQYIENLMSASSVFQAAGDSSRKSSSAKSPKKGEKR